MRYDALHRRVMGSPNESDELRLTKAIRVDMSLSSTRLDDDFVTDLSHILHDPFGGLDEIDQLCRMAYHGEPSFEADSRALLTVFVLRKLKEMNSLLKLDCLSSGLTSGRCTEYVNGNNWKDRSLIGYFDFENSNSLSGMYVSDLNQSFVRIFTDRIATLLSTGTSDNFLVADMRNTIYDVVVNAWFGYSGSVFETFAALNAVIGMATRGEAIRERDMDGCGYRQYLNYSILLPRQDISNGLTYEINKTGLMQFVDLVEGLNLGDMPGFGEIAALIRAA
ncbi:MAG: hypothetical protein FWF79_09635 [Defluviitaleaceae bacterium]|nr:hypothetical protein [Defluviitaleaceae bacterium]